MSEASAEVEGRSKRKRNSTADKRYGAGSKHGGWLLAIGVARDSTHTYTHGGANYRARGLPITGGERQGHVRGGTALDHRDLGALIGVLLTPPAMIDRKSDRKVA